MSSQTPQNRRGSSNRPNRDRRPRGITFTVKEQLLGKYGPRGYGRILSALRELAGGDA